MVLDHSAEYDSEWQAMRSIAGKFGMTTETLRGWVRQHERDKGSRPGLTTAERERLKALEREDREFKRANEILKAPRLFSGRSDHGLNGIVSPRS